MMYNTNEADPDELESDVRYNYFYHDIDCPGSTTQTTTATSTPTTTVTSTRTTTLTTTIIETTATTTTTQSTTPTTTGLECFVDAFRGPVARSGVDNAGYFHGHPRETRTAKRNRDLTQRDCGVLCVQSGTYRCVGFHYKRNSQGVTCELFGTVESNGRQFFGPPDLVAPGDYVRFAETDGAIDARQLAVSVHESNNGEVTLDVLQNAIEFMLQTQKADGFEGFEVLNPVSGRARPTESALLSPAGILFVPTNLLKALLSLGPDVNVYFRDERCPLYELTSTTATTTSESPTAGPTSMPSDSPSLMPSTQHPDSTTTMTTTQTSTINCEVRAFVKYRCFCS